MAKAPDGNGGLYRALRDGGALADMAARGVAALDVVCVDNALARAGDPEFLGACWAAGAEVRGQGHGGGAWGLGWVRRTCLPAKKTEKCNALDHPKAAPSKSTKRAQASPRPL